METVLGVSITSTSVGWVLVDGSAADGATLDHDAFDVEAGDTSQHAVAVRGAQAIAAATGHSVRSIGVTWTDDAEAEARTLLQSLRDSGYENLVEVRLPAAAQWWAQRIGRDLGYETTAVAVVEPAAVTLFTVDADDGAVHTDVTQARASASADGLSQWLTDVFHGDRRQPDSLLLVGSRSDRDELTEPLNKALPMAVIGTAEAQLVLARGAALVLAHNVLARNVVNTDAPAAEGPANDPRPQGQSWLASHARVLTIATAGVVSIAIALFAVIPQLAAEKESRQPTENPTGAVPSVTPATAHAVPAPVSAPPAAPPQTLAAEPPQTPAPTEAPVSLAVPVPEADLVEEEPASPATAEPIAVVNEPQAPPPPVAPPPEPIAPPPVEPAAPAPPPPPDPIAGVLSPLFGALP